MMKLWKLFFMSLHDSEQQSFSIFESPRRLQQVNMCGLHAKLIENKISIGRGNRAPNKSWPNWFCAAGEFSGQIYVETKNWENKKFQFHPSFTQKQQNLRKGKKIQIINKKARSKAA